MATVDSLATFFDQRYYESACAGKLKYPTERAAEQVSQMYRQNRVKHHRSLDGEWGSLVAYFCVHCGSYHLGH